MLALIFDEIQCGLGRTGTIFAFQSFGVTPDMVAIAKPIAAGLPLGAFIVKEEFATAISPGQHGTTFGGGPLACRVALEFLAIVEDEKLLENVNRVGAYLQQQLNAAGGETRGGDGQCAGGALSREFSWRFRRVRLWMQRWPKAYCSTARRIPSCDSCRHS